MVEALKGANNSTQYVAVVGYSSLLSQQEEKIKIEVSLCEPLLMPALKGEAPTLLINPVTNSALVSPISLRCIAKTEALAEKFRAALSRREAAIRDFFDIDYAVRKDGLKPGNVELVNQVRQKLAVPGNDPVDTSDQRRRILHQQVQPQLRPVLRERDFAEFDLERAFKIVVEMGKAVG